ncbi:MAG TPA: FtsX-like permease family protein, partial [Acidimicrobiales bacterium]|nr:FtsX-like permease family protein [Acidimicrobiales bacterium]
WLQVAAIALVVAIGTGVYSGLGSTAAWRRQSNDASFERLRMYDLRVRAAEGADAAAGDLLAVLGSLPDPGIVAVAEERLVVPTQVDASTAGDSILVPGRLVGMAVTAGGARVNAVHVEDGLGRPLVAADAGRPVALLERNFAAFYDLPAQGRVRVAGQDVRYVGQGLGPEYFFVITDDGGFFAQANLAVLFVPLETAQALSGRPGRVNDLVLRLAPGVDQAAAAVAVEEAFRTVGPALGATVMRTADEDAYRILYDDIESDQTFWNVFAALILAGATFGAFNLASRMVEAQRREIGIGMALGTPTRLLALRPLLAGAQIAVLGAVLGVGVGLLVTVAIRPVFESMLPLPVWRTELDPVLLARGAAIGFVLPVLATAWPVWRAVRVMPVDASSTTHRDAAGGLSRALRRLRWPLSAFRRMPIGNVLRTPRRTLLTTLGIGAALTTLVALLGMLDSFFATIDANEREVLQGNPDRVAVALSGIVAEAGPEVGGVATQASVGEVEPVLRLGGTVGRAGSGSFDAVIEVLDLASRVWAPTVVRGSRDAPGVLLSEKAAADLGVGPGDEVTLEHPARTEGGLAMVQAPVAVAGVHPSPFRFNVYLDRSQLARFGAVGAANQLYVLPAPGHDADDVQRELFGLPGVASAQPVAASSQVVRDSLQDFTAIFQALQLFVLLLVVLMAYNASSINADERARERATLFAFGLPLRRVLGLETAEGLLMGLGGTVVGVGLGLAVLHWVVYSVTASTMPELGMRVALSPGTVVTAVGLGVVAVALAPLLTARRLRRMDIPGTLRVVE